ncbi:MAG: hypothetical protein KC464_16180 [Myxococcales bacterium]|nr:hypothetical protein [Myxococcales bacterium]
MPQLVRRVAILSSSLVLALGACGGDDGGTPIDAPRPDGRSVDAAPPALCINQKDADCGYVPEPLLPTELSLADQRTMAARFNPAQIHTGADVWAVSVDYLLAQGGSFTPLLQVAEHDGRLNFSYDVDETTTVSAYQDPQPDLLTTDFSGLPTTATSGRGLVYFVDGPGTNTGNDYGDETWRAAWREVQGSTDPAAAAYPPLQYAHFFWLSKADRLLAIQYWFYYPYDKFTNNHEGDWEHVNVVLRYPDGGEPTFAMAQFSFHGRQLGIDGADLYRVGDGNGGDHLVVFSGGDACLNYVPDCYCGDESGGSYPYPGRYSLGFKEDVAGMASRPGHAFAPDAYTIQLLPRLEDVDFAAEPDLSWYALPFIFGEPTVEANAVAAIATNNHRAPVGPNPAHGEYDVGIEEPDDALPFSGPQPFEVPAGWTLVNEPPSTVFADMPPRTDCVPQ